jgi:hypothetical protein
MMVMVGIGFVVLIIVVFLVIIGLREAREVDPPVTSG